MSVETDLAAEMRQSKQKLNWAGSKKRVAKGGSKLTEIMGCALLLLHPTA